MLDLSDQGTSRPTVERQVATAARTWQPAAPRVRSNLWCTPGMGVSVWGASPLSEVPLMGNRIHEDNYGSKARASPQPGPSTVTPARRRVIDPAWSDDLWISVHYPT